MAQFMVEILLMFITTDVTTLSIANKVKNI